MAKKRKIIKVVYHIFMVGLSCAMLYPLAWMLMSSFKDGDTIMRTATTLIPERFTFENYVNGWKGIGRNTFFDFFKNTLFVATLSTIGAVVSDTIVAYGFARIRFPFRKFWFALMIGSMCLPGMVLQIPRYILFNKLGWVGTYLPIIVPYFFGGAYYIFMIMQFMKNIPREMDEAAQIDGCGWLGLFRYIMLPLVKPAVVMVAVLTFIGSWSDYYSALIYLNKPKMYPAAYALKLYSDEISTNYGPMLAMSVVSLLPIMILFIIFQKSLVEGISTTGIKG